MSSAPVAAPQLWIVAGPNGSGKSTLYDRTNIEDFGRSVWIINPDLLAARIAAQEGLELYAANLASVQRIEAWLYSSIAAYQTVGVETVLSTAKYRALIATAKRSGFEIRLFYVLLRSVELNIERVRLRVAKGGHAVPEDKIRQRHRNSLEQLPWFLEQADWAEIYDNSDESPDPVGLKRDGVIQIDPKAPADLLNALTKTP